VSFVWVFNKLRADEREYEAEHPHKYDRTNEGGRLGSRPSPSW
jgi:hypothetical protein